jgi:hypothetical protein
VKDWNNKAWIRRNFPRNKYIIVQHETTADWIEKFLKDGVDATIPPPDTRYGRLTIRDGRPYQTPIYTTGLYVQPPDDYTRSVLIAVKPHELAVSSESAGGGCAVPLQPIKVTKDKMMVLHQDQACLMEELKATLKKRAKSG